jgi:hypothetical protein
VPRLCHRGAAQVVGSKGQSKRERTASSRALSFVLMLPDLADTTRRIVAMSMSRPVLLRTGRIIRTGSRLAEGGAQAESCQQWAAPQRERWMSLKAEVRIRPGKLRRQPEPQ